MNRWIPIVSAAAVCLSAAAVFQIKFRAETVAQDVAGLQRKVDEEKEAVSALKAEWSYLIQPGRIQELAETFYARLQLQPLEAEQIGTFDMLPERRPAIAPESRAALDELLISTQGLDDLIAENGRDE